MSTIILFLFLVTIVFIAWILHGGLWFRASTLPPDLGPHISPPLVTLTKALVLNSKNGPYTLVDNRPRPRISPRELLIRNHAVGLNPIDWKCVTYGFGIHTLPWISGRECTGTVEEIGSEVKGWRKGDRVWVCSTNYRDIRTSTFQELVVAAPHNLGRLPEWVFLEEGATIGVGCVASATALFDALAVPWPRLSSSSSISKNVTDGKQDKVDQWILIWGASCVTGMMATQLARLAGLRVFAVAGLHNAPELRELGAERVVDRHRPEDAIAEAKNLGIALAIDCVGEKTATYAVRALQSGGRMVYLVKRPTQELLDAHEVLAMEVLIKKFHEDIIFGKRLVDLVSDALYQRRIRPVRHEGINGGLAGIERGLKMLMEQKVSGRKLVVRVE